MEVSEKRIAANRRNLEIARKKANIWFAQRKESNKAVEFTLTCPKCGCEFIRKVRPVDYGTRRMPKFCSSKCAHSRERPIELREKVSAKLSPNKKCKTCGKIMLGAPTKKRYCSKECRIKHRDEIRASKCDMSLRKYRIACNFKFALSDYPEEFDFELVRQYGWYSPKNKKNNLGGVSRDHMFSVKAGYINKVPSTMIAHPANCRLMRHTDNEQKGAECTITLDELKRRIEAWDAKYGKYVDGM